MSIATTEVLQPSDTAPGGRKRLLIALIAVALLLAAAGGVAYLAYVAAILAFGGVLALTALEFLVAFLQAFVFAVLTCVYLNDAVHAGHH